MSKLLIGNVLNLTHEGKGVVKNDYYPIFIKDVLPNEVVEYEITKEKKKFAEGKRVRLLETNKDRVTPPCPYYGVCGGCQTQHMNARLEESFKTDSVRNTLSRHIKDIEVNECVSLSNLYNYRNKSVFHVREENNAVNIGFYKEKSRDIVDVSYCMIQKPISNEILKTVRTLIEKYNVRAYNAKQHKGYLRNIIIRSNNDNSEIQVVFVTNTKAPFNMMFVQDLINVHPNITSVVQNINRERTNLVTGKESIVLHGTDFIEDTLLTNRFRLRNQSFYQVNHEITELLYNEAIRRAEITENDIVVDAYCGIGTIGQIASQHAKKVIGIEIVEDAILDAEQNAIINDIKNAEYHVGKSEDVMRQLVDEGLKPNVVFIDPPRVGTDVEFLNALLEVEPDRIVYISCNPATLGRDIAYLSEAYDIHDVTPYNMFGKTYHVEAVVHLTKK